MDRRDRVKAEGKWYKELDLNRMVVLVELYMDDETEMGEENYEKMKPKEEDFDDEKLFELHREAFDNEMVIRELPIKMQVCGTCHGKGKHVNPSIDSHGITRDEFDADPYFEEAYFAGRYDVTCYECDGRNVVPEIDDDLANTAKYKESYDRWLDDEVDRYEANMVDAAERRYFSCFERGY